MGLAPVQPWARWARPPAIQDAEVLRPRLPPVLDWREGKRFAPETLNKLAGGNAPSLFRREAPGENRSGIEAAPAGPLTPKRFAKTIQSGQREGSATPVRRLLERSASPSASRSKWPGIYSAPCPKRFGLSPRPFLFWIARRGKRFVPSKTMERSASFKTALSWQ